MPLPNVRVGNAEALYNIGVVSRMTGISMATLRAWERRYDFHLRCGHREVTGFTLTSISCN